MKSVGLLVGPSVLVAVTLLSPRDAVAQLEDPYLGQMAPKKMTPEVFAPGIISTAHHEHSRLEFSGNGQDWTTTSACFGTESPEYSPSDVGENTSTKPIAGVYAPRTISGQ